jgi:hypothetical protein
VADAKWNQVHALASLSEAAWASAGTAEATLRVQKERNEIFRERNSVEAAKTGRMVFEGQKNREQERMFFGLDHEVKKTQLKLEQERLELERRKLEMEEDRTLVMVALAQGKKPPLTRAQKREREQAKLQRECDRMNRELSETLLLAVKHGEITLVEAGENYRASFHSVARSGTRKKP